MDATYQGTQREITTDHGIIRYHEAGDGPPLLLLPGSGIGVSGWRNYRHNLAHYATRYHCYILEFPGFGISDPAPGHPVLTAADAVITFLDTLGIDATHIIGNSMGGVVALQLAMKHPHRVRKIIAIGGIGHSILAPSPAEGTRLLQQFADNPTRDGLRRWLECMIHDPALITDELLEERWTAAAEPHAHTALKTMYGSHALTRQQQFRATPPYWSMLHTVTSPVLLAWGADDRQCPLDMALIPLRLIPDAELHVFPHCGHWVMYEAARAFERITLEFLER